MLSCDTWPPQGSEVGLAVVAGTQGRGLSPARSVPQPESPPGTGYHSSPSLAERAVCGTFLSIINPERKTLRDAEALCQGGGGAGDVGTLSTWDKEGWDNSGVVVSEV